MDIPVGVATREIQVDLPHAYTLHPKYAKFVESDPISVMAYEYKYAVITCGVSGCTTPRCEHISQKVLEIDIANYTENTLNLVIGECLEGWHAAGYEYFQFSPDTEKQMLAANSWWRRALNFFLRR